MGTEMLNHIQKITMVIHEAKTDQGNIYLDSELVMFQSFINHRNILQSLYNLGNSNQSLKEV